MKTDDQFLEDLTNYLSQGSDGIAPTVPCFINGDGSLNRERMLALPCFADFKE